MNNEPEFTLKFLRPIDPVVAMKVPASTHIAFATDEAQRFADEYQVKVLFVFNSKDYVINPTKRETGAYEPWYE